MTTTITTTTGVYQSALGPRWHELDELVRRLHQPGAIVIATGVFRIRRGNFVARLLARVARLPAAGENVAMRLVVTPNEHGEEWRRDFAGKLMTSTQRTHADGVIAERVGAQEIHLGVNVVAGALHYDCRRATLCLGPLRLPLPRWFAPRLLASEKAVGDRVAVNIEAHLPIIGLLIAYGGTISFQEVTS